MSTYTTTSTEKLLSACGGALVTSIMVTPMDVIKMRLQTQNVYTPLAKNTCCLTFDRCTLTQAMKFTKKTFSSRGKVQVAKLHECALQRTPINSQIFKGTFDGIYKIVKYEGVAALWKGLSPALLMSVPANVIYFVGYDYLKDIIQPFTQSNQADYSPLLAGAFARTVAVTMISPIELFRTRLQATATTGVNDFKHVLDGVRNMVLKDGSKALWRGLPPTLWRDVPFSAIYWMGYEKCKVALESSNRLAFSELEVSFAAGAISGMFAAAITTPFDVAKTRRQVDVGRETPSLGDSRVPAILKQIYQQDGIRGLFRGLTPRVAKIGPSCAIMVSSYEMGKIFFSKQKEL
ncbi:hypothetical protein INT47_003549 [Mucor saturninus]|uniref:Solute carrier family 25 member 40 n=1 Tax=Mucor saturninus TaxID=64648 RepID=A0A8H7QU96_9FUNG|nr:hypothetical protein INT47_003549 [Mucor saturninus]